MPHHQHWFRADFAHGAALHPDHIWRDRRSGAAQIVTGNL
jgi:hypothetical protein